jgi:hypothetical protein
MKAVLISTDYIKTPTGEYKVLEINTQSGIIADMAILDWTGITNFIQTNSFTNVHCILPTYDKRFSVKLNEICDSIGGITFQVYETGDSSITVPYIEDNDNTLILRISYDTTAVIDDEYAKDMYNFLRAIGEQTFNPKTYIPNIVDDFSNIDDFSYTSNTPNFIIKKRYPNYDKNLHPRLYKIQNLAELNALKTEVEVDTEFLQEFIDSEVLSGKRTIVRGIDVIYGGDLNVISMGGYKVSSFIREDIWENTFNENGELAKKDRPKYITYYTNATELSAYIYDADQLVLMADGSRKEFSQLETGDNVKSISLATLPLDETEYKVSEWTGSHTEFIENFEVSQTAVVVKTTKTQNTFFIRITLDDTIEWDDLPGTEILIREDDVIRFKTVNELEVGDVMELFSTETETIVSKTVTNLEITFKENTDVGTIDVEPLDLFLPLVTNAFAIIQHNACNTNFCRQYGYDCNFYYKCTDCNTQQCPAK